MLFPKKKLCVLRGERNEQADLLRPNGRRETVSGVSREQIRLLKTAATLPFLTFLEVPHFFGHETGRTPANKGRSGDFHFSLSENSYLCLAMNSDR